MTAPEPARLPEFKQQLKELVDQATQDGLSQARLAKQASVSAPVLSKALRENYELPSWDGVGKAIVSTCLQRIGPSFGNGADLAAVQLDWEQRWKAARTAQQELDTVSQCPAPAIPSARQSKTLAPRDAKVLTLAQPDPVQRELDDCRTNKRRPAGRIDRVCRVPRKITVSVVIAIGVLVVGVTVAVGFADRSNWAAPKPSAGPVTEKASNIMLVTKQGSNYFLGNGACVQGGPDTRDPAVKLFPVADVGTGSCTTLLQWTLHRQAPNVDFYYITPNSFPGHYLTADQDKPAAVTGDSQQWKLLPQPNKTWVIQAADTSGGPHCLGALPGAAGYAPLSLQPCNPDSALQDWTIEPVK